jgi:hypothetical protein
MRKFGTSTLSLILIASLAHAAPESFVYEGVLEDASGPVASSSALTLKIYDAALNCLLYEETQNVTPDSTGAFSVRVGSPVADPRRTVNDPQLSMDTVFLSSGIVRGNTTNCPGGYTAASKDGRRLVINVNSVDLSPAIEISSAPFALSATTADKISTYDSSKLLRSDGTAAVPALTDAKVSLLMNLLNGSLGTTQTGSGEVVSKGYVDGVTANLISGATAFSGDISGTVSNISVNKIKGVSVDTTGIAANKILKYDGSKWIMGDDLIGTNPGNASTTTLGLMKIGSGLKESGTGDGVISVDAGTTAGKIVQLDAAAKLPAVDGSALTNLNSVNLSAAVPITKGGTGATTAVAAMNTLSPLLVRGDLLTYDGASNVKLPVGADGLVLTADSSQPSGLKWGAISGGGGGVTSVSSTAPLSVATGTTTPVISMSQSSSTASGYLSSTDWVAFNGKLDASSVTTNADPNMILQLNSTGTAKVKGVNLYNGTTSTNLVPPATGGGYTVSLPSTAPLAGQFLQSDMAGNLNWSTMNVTMIKGSLGTPQFPTNCTINQTLVWISASDAFMCADTNAATVSTADKTIYVNSGGSDTACNGTAAGNASVAPNCAFQTLQKAVDSVPEFVRHKITIEISSNLVAPAADKAIAVVNKNITAENINDGPFVIIQGATGSEVLSGASLSGTVGIVVGSSSRGVYIKKLNFAGFTDTAVRIDGGLAVMDDTTFNNNVRGLSVSGAGRLMLGGNINIVLSNTSGPDGSRGLEISQGSVSSEAALNIDLGTGQNNRGMTVENGDISIEDDSTIYSLSTGPYLSGIEVGTGGALRVASTKSLRLNMNYNANASALNVRNGGHLSVSGTLEMSAIANQALNCENTSSCDINGVLSIPTGSSYNNYVQVRGGSVFNISGEFIIAAPLSSVGGAAVQVSDNSTFRFNPMVAGTKFYINGGGGATAIRISNNSQFKIETGMSYDLDFTGTATLIDASNMSSATISGTVISANAKYNFPLTIDETSKMTTPGGSGFEIPTRRCPSGMTSVGGGAAAYCIDTINAATAQGYYIALNSCSGRGLKVCTKHQYAMYCSLGNNLTSVWSESAEVVTCSVSSLSATADVVNNANLYRCCQ